jgi:peptidyl-prolyl cis-trans isomerase C
MSRCTPRRCRARVPTTLGAALASAALCAACARESAPPSPAATPAAVATPAPGAPPEIDRVTPLPSPLPQVAARVNGQPILTRNVQLFAVRYGLPARDKEAGAYREAVQHFVKRELLFQEAVRRRLQADDRAVEQKYDEAHLPYADEASWIGFLQQQGLDPAAFRAELRIQFTVQKLLEDEGSLVPPDVSEEELRRFHEGNPASFRTGERLRASHILVRVPADVRGERRLQFRTKADSLLARIRSGEDFARLAKENSDDVGSKSKGGELPVFHRGQINPVFENAAYALQPGQLSDVVETPFGYHIIKLHERLPETKVTLAEVRDQVKEHILKLRRDQAIEALVARLRAQARIETFL